MLHQRKRHDLADLGKALLVNSRDFQPIFMILCSLQGLRHCLGHSSTTLNSENLKGLWVVIICYLFPLSSPQSLLSRVSLRASSCAAFGAECSMPSLLLSEKHLL